MDKRTANGEGKENKEINHTLFLEVTPQHKRLIAPVYFRQNIDGYCSFLTEENTVNEADKMVLGQVPALVVHDIC